MKKVNNYCITMTKEQREIAMARAKSLGMTFSGYIKLLIYNDLKRSDNPNRVEINY